MNTSAARHLGKAANYVVKGEEYYRKAAEEIVAAQKADPSLSLRAIDRHNKWGKDYARRLVHAAARGSVTPWAGDPDGRTQRAAKQVLREAPLEQVEQVIASLPRDRQRAIGAAAGNQYMKARQDYAEEEDRMTPAKRKEREAAGEAMTRPVVSAVSSFTIISRLEVALEELRELNATGEVPAQIIEPLTKLVGAFVDELRVTRAMAGLEIDLDEVQS